ncbi:MAG: 23S rRNA (pseudouridine(1915)-N(3))-methyltransferase RlmH [Coriobacteriia bacterium]|nr:23S rRNA (pseudouridine(1915)-N(3))-methyltransferase RlmH [Coriobacteriia bacterium]MCL2536919.1 23S rRNA (pseudouridine(1915)-N(3))-methyltransferase RlmH [Coriobacteriia bacterium]
MKITIIAVGKLKEKYWKEALSEYLQRLSSFAKVDIIELPDKAASFGTADQIKAAEGESILARLSSLKGPDGQVVALDASGKQRSSEELAQHIDQLKLSGVSKLVFVIGGSHGISPAVMAQVNEALSLGPQTWPHNMVRVMLAEQIYRAFTISSNHPYHK